MHAMRGLLTMLLVLSACAGHYCRDSKADPNGRAGATELYVEMNRKSEEESLKLSERVAFAVQRSSKRASMLRSCVRLDPMMSNNSFETPISPSQSDYVMTFNLGTPPRTLRAIVDTGSDLVWVQCSPCPDCPDQSDVLFNPSQSSSYTILPCNDRFCADLHNRATCAADSSCQYTYDYQGGSTTIGKLSTDTFVLNTLDDHDTPFGNFVFGCGGENYGSFSGVDGIIGLGQGLLGLPSQISSVVSSTFSYCLVSIQDAINKTSTLRFGVATAPAQDVQYTPMLKNDYFPNYYYVGLEAMKVDGVVLDIPRESFSIDSSGQGGTIVDSGTDFTYLRQEAYQVLLGFLQKKITYPLAAGPPTAGLDLCWDVTEIGTPQFPVISFVFTGATMDLPTENSFLKVDEQSGNVCLAFQGVNGGFTIIGSTQQQNFQIIYDQENERLGFARQTCGEIK